MRPLRWLLLAIILVSTSASGQKAEEPMLKPLPVDAERLAIYRDFLTSYTKGSQSTLNVVQITMAFAYGQYGNTKCLSSFTSTDAAHQVPHFFSADSFDGSPVKVFEALKKQEPVTLMKEGKVAGILVEDDPSVFTFSEIVFDSTHTHAAFAYRFHCGSLCGHGGTVIYDLSGGKWKENHELHCGEWQS